MALAITAMMLAALPVALYLRNSTRFRPPPPVRDGPVSPVWVSVLIPARNEESSIAACVESVLASRGVALEVVVLDDHSDDRTADIVREIAARDPRVRIVSAPPLPSGWCGKQHACQTLSEHAAHPIFTFLDADVRLTPDALARMVTFLQSSEAGLVSGFPRQETGSPLERLVIPLMQWLLLCYLPLEWMRVSVHPRFGVGCGQWFMTTRTVYATVGGHHAVRASLHDGVTLPRAYRAAGYRTDICDASDLASCRMYRSSRQVWNGLAKNAREGLAAPSRIGIWTILLFGGQVLPYALVAASTHDPNIAGVSVFACLLAWAPRLHAAHRFRSSWASAVLHPLGITVLLSIQWYATVRAWKGKSIEWKGRLPPVSST